VLKVIEWRNTVYKPMKRNDAMLEPFRVNLRGRRRDRSARVARPPGGALTLAYSLGGMIVPTETRGAAFG
jgi:hypothetical protein